jgi:transporter family protein
MLAKALAMVYANPVYMRYHNDEEDWICRFWLRAGQAILEVVPIDKLSVVITLLLAFVFLREDFTVKSLIGCILIGAGTLVMVM